VPSHPRALDDLATFLRRAKRADPDGAARLRALDLGGRWVLAVTVAPLGGAPDRPVALGLRVLALEEPSTGHAAAGPAADPAAGLDATVPLAALLDRLAHRRDVLGVPPVRVLTAAWAGVSPPREGWLGAGEVAPDVLAATAVDGATRVRGGGDRSATWSARVPGTPGLPAAAALVADVLGFLPAAAAGEVLPLARSGPWWRVSSPGGHVLARAAPLLVR